jgi:homoserine kinase type II
MSAQAQQFLNTLRVSASKSNPSRTALQLTLQQLQKLADDFDLGRIIQMDEPIDTQCNTTEPFRTGQGTFLLRARHGEEYVERLEFLHSVIDSLVAAKFPCPPVIRSRKGKSWTVWGERLVEVHVFVPHDHGVHRDWGRMNAAASALGDLHTTLTRCMRGCAVVPPEMRNDISPRQCLHLLNDLMLDVTQQRHTNPDAEAAMEICQQIEGCLTYMIEDYERIIGGVPWMIVHGDYHFWNILYTADQIAGIVDYDFLQERERMFDVAYAMQSVISYLKLTRPAKGCGFDSLAWKNAQLWVDLYDAATHIPLTELERRRMPMEILRIYLVSLLTLASQGDTCPTLVAQGEDLALYRWISEQRDLFLN